MRSHKRGLSPTITQGPKTEQSGIYFHATAWVNYKNVFSVTTKTHYAYKCALK